MKLKISDDNVLNIFYFSSSASLELPFLKGTLGCWRRTRTYLDEVEDLPQVPPRRLRAALKVHIDYFLLIKRQLGAPLTGQVEG